MSRVASRDEVMALIVQQDEVEDFRDIWPAIKSGIVEAEPERKAAFSLRRRWTFAAACFIVVCLAAIFVFNFLLKDRAHWDQQGEAPFQINSIRVGDDPATPFVYQPKDSDMILVWAEKSM